ncbi:MAG: transketolase family protein [Acidimicrobiales bacterium]
MRPVFGRALIELGRTNPDVVVLSADVSNSDHTFMFQDAFPDRFINVGIAEQCLIDVAVGLSYCGKVPFATTFAFLHATRALEPIRTHLGIGEANVKLMAPYGGLSPMQEGPTHHAISDIAIMRSLPGMTIVQPADTMALEKLLPQVAAWPGPVYLRMNRNDVPLLFDDDYAPTIGQAMTLREGSDVTLVGTGLMVSRCLQAADELAGLGISAAVIDVHTIKPLDETAILVAAETTGAIVTAEEASVVGGLGGAVAEVLGANRPVPLRRVGVDDRYVSECGPYFELMDRHGMAVADIVAAATSAVAARNKG